jgi:hypothetical protein
MNGNGGALQLDLNTDIDIKSIGGPFDLVTNIGTLEHVDNFWMGFKNIHNLCKNAGIMLHVLPAIDNWPDHGYHYINEDFFRQLAWVCGYNVVDICRDTVSFGGADSNQIFATLRKTRWSEFVDVDRFYNLGVVTMPYAPKRA